MYPNVENLTTAANYLVGSTRCTRLINEMNNFIDCWAETPKLYAGELALLNPMIHLGVSHRDKYEALLQRVYAARATQAETRRTDYQKELMRRIRARETNSVALAEWQRGRRFTPQERAEFLKDQKQAWESDKSAFISRTAKDSTETRGALATFWNLVDMQLEHELQNAKANNAPPLPAKRRELVE